MRIPLDLLDSDFVEEKPEPDYYVCKEQFDPETGGRFLSREERQIARRMEFYERFAKNDAPPKKKSKATWFGVCVG